MAWKIVRWIGKGKANVKRARFDAVRQKIYDLCMNQGLYESMQETEKQMHKESQSEDWKKEHLKKNLSIKSAIEKWWYAMEKNPNNQIMESTYVDMMVLLYSILIPGGNYETARPTAEVFVNLLTLYSWIGKTMPKDKSAWPWNCFMMPFLNWQIFGANLAKHPSTAMCN